MVDTAEMLNESRTNLHKIAYYNINGLSAAGESISNFVDKVNTLVGKEVVSIESGKYKVEQPNTIREVKNNG